jgi:16S rRNA (guanine1207-N2)-methyltransferase
MEVFFDRRRIYSQPFGISSGGSMSRRLGNSAADRESRVAAVADLAVGELESSNRPIVINDRLGLFGMQEAARWNRWSHQERAGSSWPETSGHGGALLRLDPQRRAMEMAVHAAAASLAPGAELWTVGANDEGIKSVGGKLGSFFTDVETVDIRKRCRVVRSRRSGIGEGLKARLSDWREERRLELPGGGRIWTSYPGLFAGGGLDPGTAMLLEALSSRRPLAPALDFGCGPGALSAGLRQRFKTLEIDGLDADAVAMSAYRENMPDCGAFVSDGWNGLPADRRYGWILSNPPIHVGCGEDMGLLHALIAGARARLRRRGELWLVVQRQVPVQKLLSQSFSTSSAVRKDSRYWVWRAK